MRRRLAWEKPLGSGWWVELPVQSCACPAQRPQVASVGSAPPRPGAEMKHDARSACQGARVAREPEGGVNRGEGPALEVQPGPPHVSG